MNVRTLIVVICIIGFAFFTASSCGRKVEPTRDSLSFKSSWKFKDGMNLDDVLNAPFLPVKPPSGRLLEFGNNYFEGFIPDIENESELMLWWPGGEGSNLRGISLITYGVIKEDKLAELLMAHASIRSQVRIKKMVVISGDGNRELGGVTSE